MEQATYKQATEICQTLQGNNAYLYLGRLVILCNLANQTMEALMKGAVESNKVPDVLIRACLPALVWPSFRNLILSSEGIHAGTVEHFIRTGEWVEHPHIIPPDGGEAPISTVDDFLNNI